MPYWLRFDSRVLSSMMLVANSIWHLIVTEKVIHARISFQRHPEPAAGGPELAVCELPEQFVQGFLEHIVQRVPEPSA